MNPLVSIIVPVYNVEEYLDECVESLANQTYPDIEIILVDDGSPDDCPQICDAWAKRDNRIKVIHKANGGVSSARNAGLDIANGEWIWFVDSDDTVEANALEELLSNKDDSDLIVFSSSTDELYTKDEKFFDEYYFKYRFGFEPWNKLYKKSIIKNNNLQFDTQETVGEDLLFNITYYQYANNYKFIASQYYNYRVRENSAMQSNNEKRIEQQLRLYSKIYDIYRDKVDERILAQLYIMHLISGINQCGKQNFDDEKIKIIQDSVIKYNFKKDVFKKAISSFLDCENASFLGRIRATAVLKLIFKTKVKLSLKLL
ncbi:glycosyltransferase family 2 protein [uncultured Eubacterium sp.]|uniref:glycosyltransferase family 2 protein n=1 Tax=uncultured Eubacterium sp. TaxID=165185 RepID=UPI0015B92181|nr:glycosyltransferase family 2 protein [uncultured Eubacterium sp.]